MKLFSVSAFFPEVKPAHQAFQSCTAYGSTFSIALRAALKEFRGLRGIKGKRIREVRLVVKEISE